MCVGGWFSNVDGLLSEQQSFDTNDLTVSCNDKCEIGAHLITLRVIDSQGLEFVTNTYLTVNGSCPQCLYRADLNHDGIIDMRDKISFGDLITKDGNIVINIGRDQYNVEQITKANVLSAIVEVVKAGVSGQDITLTLKALAPKVAARGDISEEEIVDTVKENFEGNIEGDSEKQKFMQVIKQVIIGASGSILGSGIIKGIKLIIGLPLP